MPPSVEDAVAAIDAAIAVLEAAQAKAEDAIADDLFKGRDTDEEIAEVANLNVEIQTLENRKIELEAAGVVVSAPSVAEIAEVKGLITQIQELAMQDAVRAASLEFLQSALTRARELSGNVA